MSASLSHLHERRLETVRHDADSHEWVFSFSGDVILRIASPWRVLVGERVAAGWEDHDQKFGLLSPVDLPARCCSLAGAGIVRTATHDSTGDLALQFDNGSVLEVFNASSGYESWILNGPGKRSVVAQGGGHVVDSEADG